jgi:hypothetical protein
VHIDISVCKWLTDYHYNVHFSIADHKTPI